MSAEHLEVLVEEQSMETALNQLIPKILPAVSFKVHPFFGKTHLLKRLPQRLRAYAHWLPETHRLVVVIDRDDDDCRDLKRRLDDIAEGAWRAAGGRSHGLPLVLNRLAIEELEAWYFGDWDAVVQAYPRMPTTVPFQAAYRDPDAIPGTWEALERLFQRAGYFAGGLPKIEVARTVTAYMEPSRNRSRSFQCLRTALLSFGRGGVA